MEILCSEVLPSLLFEVSHLEKIELEITHQYTRYGNFQQWLGLHHHTTFKKVKTAIANLRLTRQTLNSILPSSSPLAEISKKQFDIVRLSGKNDGWENFFLNGDFFLVEEKSAITKKER